MEKHRAIADEMQSTVREMKGQKPTGVTTMFRLLLCWVQSVNAKLDDISKAIKNIEVVDDEVIE